MNKQLEKRRVFDDGTPGVKYYLNGVLHREDGPAVIWRNGTKHWLIHGKSHRSDGPCTEWSDGEKRYSFYSERYSLRDYKKVLLLTSIFRLKYVQGR